MKKLRRPWFGGGNVIGVTTQATLYIPLDHDRGGFEDGTLNYANIPGISIGIQWIKSLGRETIHNRVVALTSWTLDFLKNLKHSDGVCSFFFCLLAIPLSCA